MFACQDGYSITVGRAEMNEPERLYIIYDMVQEDTGTSSPTPTDSIDETPTDSIDVTSAPSQNISASVTRHTSHKLTEAEILAICPILPPQTEQTEPPYTYTQTSQSYQEDNRKVVETELLNKRLSPGTYTIHVDTTYTITYNWKHNHISSCACPGNHYDYTDEDGHTHYKSCGTYCRCTYSAEKTTQQQYHSHNLNKDTYVTITIVNCDPKIEIAKKTVKRTEADTINWGTITEGISEIKDHEDMSIHSGVGVTCGICAGTEIDYTIWKNISNAMNATETTGKIKFEKKPIERSGIGKEKAEITIDIGKLRLNQQNPGGKYPVKIEVTDSDGATTTNEFTVDIDWSKPDIPESTNPSGDNYYTARNDYQIIREMPAGYGFADMVFVPLPGRDKPAMVVELKWNKKCETALDQIREKKYIEALKGYKGEVILVGISYEKRSEKKEHVCKIDRVVLEN